MSCIIYLIFQTEFGADDVFAPQATQTASVELGIAFAIHAPDFVPRRIAMRAIAIGIADIGFQATIAPMKDVTFAEIISVAVTEARDVIFFGLFVVEASHIIAVRGPAFGSRHSFLQG
jgi:hypothetical protein